MMIIIIESISEEKYLKKEKVKKVLKPEFINFQKPSSIHLR